MDMFGFPWWSTAGEYGDKNIASSWSNVLDVFCRQGSEFTTSILTEPTTQAEIFIFAGQTLNMARYIVDSESFSGGEKWSDAYWNLASLLLTTMEAITRYARQTDSNLFSEPSLRNVWWSCIQEAEYVALASQRYLGNREHTGEIFSLPESLRGNPPPRRRAGEGVAGTLAARTRGGGGLGTDFDLSGGLVANSGDVGYSLTASAQQSLDAERETLIAVAHSLCSEGFDASEDGTGRGTPIVPVAHPIAIQERAVSDNPDNGPDGVGCRTDGAAYTLEARTTPQAVAFDSKASQPTIAWSIMPQNSGKDYKAREVDVAQPIMAGGPTTGNQGGDIIQQRWAVRRLTPTECERLQALPDGFTDIPGAKPMADGPRYKMLGNAWAMNAGEAVFEGIRRVEAMAEEMTA
jgi:hypothetical protein